MIYLTEKYNKFFEKRSFLSCFKLVAIIPSFISDIIKSGKFVELTSFVRWELMFYLKLFPKNSCIKFNKSSHIDATKDFNLNEDKLNTIIKEYNDKNENLFIEKLEKALCVLFYDYYNQLYYGVEFNKNNILLISKDGKIFDFKYQFDEQIHAIFVTQDGITILNSGNKIFRKTNNNKFDLVLELSSKNSFLRHNGCFSEDNNGNIYIAEYGQDWDINGNWLSLAYLYISMNNGKDWDKIDFFKKMGANKHLHLVFFDKLLNCLIVTDGDNHKRLWINFSMKELNIQAKSPNEDGWYLVNKTHFRKGGHISAANFLNKTVFGSDYLGGQNFLITSQDLTNYQTFFLPYPYRRNPINSLVKMESDTQDILWASIHTMQNFKKSKGLIMYSEDLETWNKVFEYCGNDYLISLISTSNNKTNDIYILIRNTDDEKNEVLTIRISKR